MKYQTILSVSILSMFIVNIECASIFKLKMQDKLSVDFLTGFESGIFLRNNSQQFEEYGCPE